MNLALDDELTPERCKIHLACWNGIEDPLDVYFAGNFDEWQRGAPRRNYERDLVLSLIALPQPDRWLFAGLHDSCGSTWDAAKHEYRYDLRRRPGTNELDGRLVVAFKRHGRASYMLAEKWTDEFIVAEILPQKKTIGAFPGYTHATLTRQRLDIVVSQAIESWRAALSAVAGVYVIADRATGKLYVGSATGEGGIWGRWCAYALGGHGGNVEIKQLLQEEGAAYADHFQYGILEIADKLTSPDEVVAREAYWKDLLLSREHGYNAN